MASIVLIVGDQVMQVWRRHFAHAKGRSRVDYLGELLRRLRDMHGVDEVVVEPGSAAHHAATIAGFKVRTLRLIEAKAELFSATPGTTTHRDLVAHLADRHPVLEAHVTRLRSGEIATAPDQRWQTVNVLAAALGLAAAMRCRARA